MIVYCCTDLLFATKVRSTAEALDVVSRPVRNAEMLQKRLDRVDDGKPNDAVRALFIDLEAPVEGGDVMDLIRMAKAPRSEGESSPVEVIAFASHVAVELLQAAPKAGANGVFTRGAFTQQLPELLAKYRAD